MKSIRLLYVEDDEDLSFLTKEELQSKGYKVIHCANGGDAIQYFDNEHFDLVILDIMLPIKDGFSIATHIRNKDSDIPIIFLSAKSLEKDRLKGFEIGADDYLTKPFSIDELLYKIKVFLKRHKLTNFSGISEIRIGNYDFEPSNLILRNGDREIELTAKEANLLSFLYKNKNKTLKREDILIELWGKNDYFLGRSLDVFISRLRKYLNEDASIEIQTIRGLGFKLSVN